MEAFLKALDLAETELDCLKYQYSIFEWTLRFNTYRERELYFRKNAYYFVFWTKRSRGDISIFILLKYASTWSCYNK
jgi:hypothetical protein